MKCVDSVYFIVFLHTVSARDPGVKSISLWPLYGQAIIFCSCGFYLLLFPMLILSGRRLDVCCLPYFHTWCGLSANLECMPEMCCTQLTENKLTWRKNYAKIAVCAPSMNFVRPSQVRHEDLSTIGRQELIRR